MFEDIFGGVSRGRSRFDVMAEDLDILLPDGWSERAFRTSTKCVICWEQPITIRFANQRKLESSLRVSPLPVVWKWRKTGAVSAEKDLAC